MDGEGVHDLVMQDFGVRGVWAGTVWLCMGLKHQRLVNTVRFTDKMLKQKTPTVKNVDG
jgi:hypothetical protein